jgi:uncharacterized protein (DUF1778 family)
MANERPLRQLTIRTTPLAVSFSLTERTDVQKAARLSDQSVSAFIRAAAVKAAARTLAREERKAA